MKTTLLRRAVPSTKTVVDALRRACRYVNAGLSEKATLSLLPFQHNILCAELATFLTAGRIYGKRLSDGEPPLILWERTRFAKLHKRHKLSALTRFSAQILKRRQTNKTVLVDVGPGDGKLLGRYLQGLRKLAPGREFHVVLIEPSKHLLPYAVKECSAAGLAAENITLIPKAIENISRREMNKIRALGPLITLASESLHHLPHETKLEVLRSLGSVSEFVLLNELEADHDFPEQGSSRLVASAYRFYGFLLGQVYKTRLSQAARRRCIEQFIFAEAAAVLLKSRRLRGNFHCTEAQWTACFRSGSFAPLAVHHSQLMADAPRALSFALTQGRQT